MTTGLETISLANSQLVKVFIEKFPLPVALAINEKIHMANLAYARLTGYDRPEMMRGMHVSEFIDPTDRQRFMRLNRNAHSGLVSGQTYRWK